MILVMIMNRNHDTHHLYVRDTSTPFEWRFEEAPYGKTQGGADYIDGTFFPAAGGRSHSAVG
jgi:hypothetical protein